jgi:SAM-dependent methyltransferase
MEHSSLVRLLGFPATLIHGDPAVLDRWNWLKQRLPITANGEKLIDIGCGTGAFTIGAAKRGYQALGLSWDQRNQSVAAARAGMCRAAHATFEICDVRRLDERTEYFGQFDVAVCAENIEHILNDFKLVEDIARCLKPGGRLLLTTPNYHLRAITPEDNGPFSQTETGWHVRRGYTKAMLLELCEHAGLVCEAISFCTGLLSQKATGLMRWGSRLHPLVGWGAVLPLRPLIPLIDPLATTCFAWPCYSICLEACKPRRGTEKRCQSQCGENQLATVRG